LTASSVIDGVLLPTDERADGLGFDAVFRQEAPGLRRLAYLMTGELEAAEEIVQDVFAGAWPRWADLDNPAGYLHQGVVNRCLSWRRRAGREERTADPPVRSTAAPPELDETWALLATLPRDWRVALVLRFYEDLGDNDIAGLVGCRAGTVRTRIHRALAHLRKELHR
jgi:RNA polymerase sigma factor (sigma-70 family)